MARAQKAKTTADGGSKDHIITVRERRRLLRIPRNAKAKLG